MRPDPLQGDHTKLGQVGHGDNCALFRAIYPQPIVPAGVRKVTRKILTIDVDTETLGENFIWPTGAQS